MIKKSVFEEELISGMQVKLAEVQSGRETDSLLEAVNLLHSAAEILEEAGLTSAADKVVEVLQKVAECDPAKAPDRHLRNLTPENQVKNLLDHGTQFNLSDDGVLEVNDSDDLLSADINFEVTEEDFLLSFEDEK